MASIIVLATAVTVVMAGAPARAADLRCSGSWHYITHGQTGRNVRPDPTMHQGNTTLYADATPGADFWNQQFLFCRDPAWEPDVYAIYSNLTGAYWSTGADGSVWAGAGAVETRSQTFVVRRYDSTWWVIQSRHITHVFTPYVSPDLRPFEYPMLRVGEGPLNGGHLFRISPSNLMG